MFITRSDVGRNPSGHRYVVSTTASLRDGILHSVLVGIDAKVPLEMCHSTFLDRLLPQPTYLSRSVDCCAEDRNSSQSGFRRSNSSVIDLAPQSPGAVDLTSDGRLRPQFHAASFSDRAPWHLSLFDPGRNSYCQCCAAGHQSPDYRRIRRRQECDRWEKSSQSFRSHGQCRSRGSPILVLPMLWPGAAGDSRVDRAPGTQSTIQVNTDR